MPPRALQELRMLSVLLKADSPNAFSGHGLRLTSEAQEAQMTKTGEELAPSPPG